MSEIDGTLPGVSPPETTSKKAGAAERAAVRELVRAARARGEDLTGPDGLLKVITKTVLESALEEELAEHLGFDKHQGPKDGGNIRKPPGSRLLHSRHSVEWIVNCVFDRCVSVSPPGTLRRPRPPERWRPGEWTVNRSSILLPSVVRPKKSSVIVWFIGVRVAVPGVVPAGGVSVDVAVDVAVAAAALEASGTEPAIEAKAAAPVARKPCP
jgi:hypothetical protein